MELVKWQTSWLVRTLSSMSSIALPRPGFGRAYCAGFAWALERGFEFIMEMDGDLSHNPDDIPAFLKAAEGADLVLGSR